MIPSIISAFYCAERTQEILALVNFQLHSAPCRSGPHNLWFCAILLCASRRFQSRPERNFHRVQRMGDDYRFHVREGAP